MFLLIMTGKYELPDQLSPECKDLIKSILVVNPENRATLEHMRNHAWTTASDTLPSLHLCGGTLCCLDPPQDNPEIVDKLQSLGKYSTREISASLKQEYPSKIGAAYHIIKRSAGADQERLAKLGTQNWNGGFDLITQMSKLEIYKKESKAAAEAPEVQEIASARVSTSSRIITEDEDEDDGAPRKSTSTYSGSYSRANPSARRATLMSAKDRIEKRRASSNRL